MEKSSAKLACMLLMFFIVSETLFVSEARHVVNVPCNTEKDCSNPGRCICNFHLCFCKAESTETILDKILPKSLGEQKTTP
uniref:Uncharacterized protein n=1 Tax=Cucumis melo TaxID=3656 RepID=A0A9I9EFP0_CUCME